MHLLSMPRFLIDLELFLCMMKVMDIISSIWGISCFIFTEKTSVCVWVGRVRFKETGRRDKKVVEALQIFVGSFAMLLL